MGWDTRLAWSGEQPANDKVLLQRFETYADQGVTASLPDSAGAPDWTLVHWDASTVNLVRAPYGTYVTYNPRMGRIMVFNRANPATEQTSLHASYFPGLWPSAGKVLVGMWICPRYSSAYNPVASTRNDASRAPLMYIDFTSSGAIRHMVYGSDGSQIKNQAEQPTTFPWASAGSIIGKWLYVCQLVDLDAKTTQVALVREDLHQAWVSPVRTVNGTPNKSCTADLDFLTISPADSYWANGECDEATVMHPGADFDLSDWIEQVRLSTWARGACYQEVSTALTVTDSGVAASAAATLQTGAEAAAWDTPPAVSSGISGTPLALMSSDDGATWTDPTTPSALPESFSGLVRWHVPMVAGETFTGINLSEPAPVPVLEPLPPIAVEAGGTFTVTMAGTWIGVPVFAASPEPGLAVTFNGVSMAVVATLAIGLRHIAVTVTDDTGQTSEPITIEVTVQPPEWDPPDNPVFAHAPLLVYDADGVKSDLVIGLSQAVTVKEVNGEHTLTVALPARHPRAGLFAPERAVEIAGEVFRVRRLKTWRDGRIPKLEAYCEARFYDLAYAGQVEAREWTGSQAGDELAAVLDGTGWTVDTVNVSTVRTWSMAEGSPLECARAIAKVHGGDLTFDNNAKTVSLLVFAGKDQGAAFFYGHGLTQSARLEDTTSLITRLYCRNAEGETIAPVNGGLPYIENYTHTTELRTAVYDFKSGTSPYTMLETGTALLARRCKPDVSYEFAAVDLSAWSGQDLDRFDSGDRVTAVDQDLGIDATQRIVRLEYDHLRPWQTAITLSGKLRELGDDSGDDAGILDTGATVDTKDLVPFNLLLNARFDSGVAHWATSGAEIVDGGATGPRAVRFAGPGVRWIEQTVAPDTRDTYALSLQVDQSGGPDGWIPDMAVEVEIVYTDGTSETVVLDLA
jgi:phage minor structural protein